MKKSKLKQKIHLLKEIIEEYAHEINVLKFSNESKKLNFSRESREEFNSLLADFNQAIEATGKPSVTTKNLAKYIIEMQSKPTIQPVTYSQAVAEKRIAHNVVEKCLKACSSLNAPEYPSNSDRKTAINDCVNALKRLKRMAYQDLIKDTLP